MVRIVLHHNHGMNPNDVFQFHDIGNEDPD